MKSLFDKDNLKWYKMVSSVELVQSQLCTHHVLLGKKVSSHRFLVVVFLIGITCLVLKLVLWSHLLLVSQDYLITSRPVLQGDYGWGLLVVGEMEWLIDWHCYLGLEI